MPTSNDPPATPAGTPSTYIFVFLSGVAALIYEVVWSRQLATFLGITTYAHTVVLATFMLGFALGSRVLGQRADQSKDPLRLFGWLEAGIGVYAVAALWLLPFLQQAYSGVARNLPDPTSAVSGPTAHLARLLLAASCLIIPTFLMGGTVPALVRGLTHRDSGVASTLGRIYGTNTLGAATGAAAAGYLLLPRLGTVGTVAVAVFCNLVAAAAFLRRRATVAAAPTKAPRKQEAGSFKRWDLMVILGISGFAALALQLGWVRALTLVMGSSVYAFSLTLATYLAGLALGSFVLSRWFSRSAPNYSPLSGSGRLGWGAGLALAAGFSAALGLLLIGRLPELFLAGYRLGWHESFATLQLFLLAVTASVILVPTTCLGALFPLLAAAASPTTNNLGASVGLAYAANSLGTVLGAVAAGLLLLPWIGVHNTILFAAGLHIVVGCALWLRHRPSSRGRVLVAATLALFASIAFLLPKWDRAVMTSGPFINAARIVDVPAGREFREWIRERNQILFYDEGADGSVSVREFGAERLLVINGKTDGSRLGDRKTQLAIGHLPLLMHEAPRNVLMIGFGTGMSAGAVMAHDVVENLEVLEISREVVAASRFFEDDNQRVLEDPRLTIHYADARNYLHATNKLYDVIVSEPSNPWISGISNLFTREFFTTVLQRLAVGGVMSQWFHTYAMSEEDLKTVVRTFESVFPEVSIWVPQVGDLVLIGSRTPHWLRHTRVRQMFTSPRAVAGLLSVDMINTESLARMFLLNDRDIETLVDDAPLNTDQHPRVEFSAPRNLYAETATPNMTGLVAHLSGQPRAVPLTGLRRNRPDETEFQAFGIGLRWPDAATPATQATQSTQQGPRAEWLVTWTAPIDSEEGRLPQFAVGNRRVITFAEAEITCAFETEPPGLDTLARRLAGYTAELSKPQETRLGDGTPSVWLIGHDQTGEPFSGLAWTCGETTEGWSRYVATVRAGPDSGQLAKDLALGLRCLAD